MKPADLINAVADGKSVSLSVKKLIDTEPKQVIVNETLSALEMVEFAYIDLYASLNLYRSQVLNESMIDDVKLKRVDNALKMLEDIKKVIA